MNVIKKYNVGLCYLYNNKLCNLNYENKDEFKEHFYLVHYNLELKNFYNNKYCKYLNYINKNLCNFYKDNFDYKHMCKFMIYEPLLLDSGELMAINKTFWINIFIRKVKKYIKNKMNNMNFIIYRNKNKYDYFNNKIKSFVLLEKVILNSSFKNVKTYVEKLDQLYKEQKENNDKLNIIDDNTDFEITFTFEICNNNKIITL